MLFFIALKTEDKIDYITVTRPIIKINIFKQGIIQVIDQGEGIKSSVKQQIFQPFVKFPPNKQGHGLGLALVSEVMSLHGGHAELITTKEQGSCFQLSFPI